MPANATLPKPLSFLLCERVDDADGVPSLIHLATEIALPKFPYRLLGLTAYAELTGGVGTYTFTIEIDDGRNPPASITKDWAFVDRLLPLALRGVFDGVVFREPGVYAVRLLCNGEFLVDRALRVIRADSPTS